MDYLMAKWLHVVSSTVLFGTGIGSAYYLLVVSLGREARTVALVSRHVVRADWLFTGTTAVFQPLSGFYLVKLMNIPVSTPWVIASVVLYGIAIACWLPVVVIQMRLRDLAVEAARNGRALPADYWDWFRWWLCLGFPALACFLAIFYLMIAKPALPGLAAILPV
jgi:uncharacterized membrane protein